MLFNSVEFALFLPPVLALYWALPPGRRNGLLLLASYVFYGSWDWRFLSLLWISTVADFTVGRAMARSDEPSARKRLLLLSVAVNLGILGAFKYSGFFVGSAAAFLRGFGLDAHPDLLTLILPVGISFYTFQTISYTFDVYRRRIAPVPRLMEFALYVAYFPQLVAGPIERARRLLPQLLGPRPKLTSDGLRSGLFLVLLGLFKKVAIADPLGEVADAAFNTGGAADSATLLIGLLAFALQIYGDFSGYSDIARGISRLFGIELMRNFEQPYLSRNITEFWRTWHVSLSTWLHDYLYVPLGGNKRGSIVTYRNLMLTMLLGGLWHGASWSFVAWGGLHGSLLALHRHFCSPVPRDRPQPVRLGDVPKIIGTFSMICVVWTFFRAPSFEVALDYLWGTARLPTAWPNLDHLALLLFSAVAMVTIDVAQRNSGRHVVILEWRPALQGLTYAALVLSIIIWSGGETHPFIYFQF